MDEYIAQTGYAGYDANAAANTARSFLIHNSGFMDGTPFTG